MMSDGARYEPHYEEITGNDQAQIHELIMVNSADDATTGLLHGVRYIKNNRMLPAGFDKATEEVDVAVHGATIVESPSAGYQWIENLRPCDAEAPQQFVRYCTSMANLSDRRSWPKFWDHRVARSLS